MLYIEFRCHAVRMLKPRQGIDCQTSWQRYTAFVLLINLEQVVEFIALTQAFGNLAHRSIHFTLSFPLGIKDAAREMRSAALV